MWRATCSFPENKTDMLHDYVRAQINKVDMLRPEGFEQCRKVDYINIGGRIGINITVAFWKDNRVSHPTDSSRSNCDFDVGSIEDSNACRCIKSSESITQYWYGVNV